jgi:O-antigen chain-terminating methyltransferase
MSEELAQLRGRLQALKNQCRTIGQIPPRPPGLRAAIGAAGVSIMHRLMFWYAPALQQVIGGLIQTVDDALGAQPGGMEGFLEQERLTTIGLESTVQEQADALQQLAEEQRLKEEALEKRWEAAEERHQLLRREVLANGQRLVRLLDESRRMSQGTPAPVTAYSAGALGEEDLEPLYAALESEVRGTRGEVQKRWKEYLPLIPRDGPVLDLGCGRGEWLELLRQEGIAAHGVDSNRLMVAECRERQLTAERAEALEYLAQVPDGSLGAVTVLRVLERFPFPQLVRLIDEVARVLRPGGAAIFEAPNPDNILVACRDFYKDPVRRHPIPSEVLRFLVESRGLLPSQVLFLNALDAPGRLPEEDASAVTRRFNRYFYGPRDYAIVAHRE